MALFSPSANSLFTTFLVLVLLAVVGGSVGLCLYVRTPYNTSEGEQIVQPVMFDHRHHVADDGIDCRYCHYTVDTSPFAGVPPSSLCMNCHAQIWTASVQLAAVRASYFTDQPLAWKRVNAVPAFVFFDHSIHVSRGVGCVTCHGRVDRMPAVYKAQPLTMQWCLACHRDPVPYLRPQDRITDMTWEPPDQIALGKKISEERKINPPTNCSGCHR